MCITSIWCLILAYNTLVSFFCFFFIVFSSSLVLILLRYEFIAYLLLLIYLGGILIFFLFVCLLLNVNINIKRHKALNEVREINNNVIIWILFIKLGCIFYILYNNIIF